MMEEKRQRMQFHTMVKVLLGQQKFNAWKAQAERLFRVVSFFFIEKHESKNRKGC
jgi:hypothetical protein